MRRTEIKKVISVVITSALLAGNMNLLPYAATEDGRQQENTVDVTPDAPINSNAGDFEYKSVLTCSDLSCAVADIPIPENVKVIATRNV